MAEAIPMIHVAQHEANGKRWVEASFREGDEESASATIEIHIEVDPAGHQRIEECLEEALRRMRATVTAELRRIEHIRDQRA